MAKQNKKTSKKSGTTGYVIVTFLCTFFVAALVYLFSQLALENISSLIVGIIMLAVVILIGICFDVIGTAVAVADNKVFNAKASRRLPGAKKALALSNRADKVANICNDVIGDICGTVSGGIGTALVYIMVSANGSAGFWVSVVITGLIAAFTVAGKALGKNFAISNADNIIWTVGRILDWRAVFFDRKSRGL